MIRPEGNCTYLDERISNQKAIDGSAIVNLIVCTDLALPGLDKCHIHAPREEMGRKIEVLNGKVNSMACFKGPVL